MGNPLAARLVENGQTILRVYRNMAEAVDQGSAITPAAEWLIDNYYLVERQIREIRSDLPSGYYRQLPKLATGPFEKYPRVFGLAWAFVAHTDSDFDSEMLFRFIRAYQEVQPLTIGELWAISITLRIVLVENLARLASQMMGNRLARQEADGVADRIIGTDAQPPEPAALVLARYQSALLTDAFTVQLVHRLRDQDPAVNPALAWLDQQLEAQGKTADTAVHDVHRRQGSTNVTVRNIITSLRLISDVDWKDLFERVSLVYEVLAATGSFPDMDFPTRNLYRSAVEDLARGSGKTELDVARGAVEAATLDPALHDVDDDARRRDPGYYLFGGGRLALETTLQFRQSIRNWPARINRALGIGGYATGIALLTAILLLLPLIFLATKGIGTAQLIVFGALGLVPAIDVAVALLNRAVTSAVGATLLPALELRDGIPSHLRTVVAVPTLLTTLEAIGEQVERLEIHHLASPEGDLHFALLSDWTDATTEHVQADESLLNSAAAAISGLNQKYGPASGGDRFLLLHRRRVWNEGEARWIGWERKRGKLHELNRLLRGAGDTTFIDIGGKSPTVPAEVRYVVTLDADTRLPRDTVRRLIGKMAHPINRPRLDTVRNRVVEGYAVLQPRVTPSLPIGREGSFFQHIFSSISGIDPYASAVSDVYQDLFGEGSYAGKGIYDVDAFEASLAGRVGESTMLSHDLFEGLFARAGLASDVEVVEEFPARYDVGALRHHRWARGDWQLLPWIFGTDPLAAGTDRATRSIPAIGRWKMLDNLRRSLSAPMAVLALLAGWMMPAQAAGGWTVFILASIVLPAMLPVIAAIPPRRVGVTIASHARAFAGDLRLALLYSGLTLIFLAHEAWLMSDAIIRTLWRLAISHHHLLEWTPAAEAASRPELNLPGFYRSMQGALVVAAAGVILALVSDRAALALAVPFAAIWLASPAVALWVSRPPRDAGQLPIQADDANALRLVARRTWRFFETFVTAADHMLPPDNFQEEPTPTIAHRTSPTNLGLYLLAVASARDFGWIGTSTAVGRLAATLSTMNGLPRLRGHFFNWYDTTDLRVLNPQYVSSVDSGNLAGHLLALANTCREWRTVGVDDAAPIAGIADTVALGRLEVSRSVDGRRTQTVTWRQLDEAFSRLETVVRGGHGKYHEPRERLVAAQEQAVKAVDVARAFAAERGAEACADLVFWTEASLDSIRSHLVDFTRTPDETSALNARLQALEADTRSMAMEMEFGFLFDPKRSLLSIGYQVAEGSLDQNCYDLLASEARLASFVAIAKGDIPARHWFRLGRSATPVGFGTALISWSGSMFEYLMPSLVMRAPADSLLEQTNRLAVRRQIEYGASLRLPWGISEAAYNARDIELTYQYSNFGVPGLGLKRGLGESRVIAPYATALATMVDPGAACANLVRLEAAGGLGRYGFYESLDYTPVRLPEGQSVAIVAAFMAHHQGMSIVAIADAVFHGRMRARFHAEPVIQATELLLQERAPRDVVAARTWAADVKTETVERDLNAPVGRRLTGAHQPTPATHLLSNGRYTTMITAAGSGYSRWGNVAVTRWREDATSDDFGSYVFLRDVRGGTVWSAGFQPAGAEPDRYNIVFNEDSGEISRQDGTLTTSLEIIVSAEDDAEVRRVSISNTGFRVREIELTSYMELSLAPQADDIAHPAFAKLFVETEYLGESGVILATRRRRAPTEPEIWAAHLSVVEGEVVGKIDIETDRARFLGRGNSVRNPISVMDGRPLSNTVGTVLDPIFALRRRVRISPGTTVRVAFWTMTAGTRKEILDSADKHREVAAFTRAATLAWTQEQVQLYHLGISPSEAGLFQRLAGHLIFVTSSLRPSSAAIVRGAGAQSGLWPLGISGDLPILLLRISDLEDLDIVRDLLQAHEYFLMKRVAIDLVILNERQSSYVQDLQIAIEALVRSRISSPRAGLDAPHGNVFALRSDLVPLESRALLAASARVVLVAQRGSLFDQLERLSETGVPAPMPKPALTRPDLKALQETPALEFFNGLGGFAENGAEYVTILGPGQSTPAPWINVVANAGFGFQVATEGSGYTWDVNSRENQLTQWSNDPVSDRSGEALYIRDEDSDELWSPTIHPIRDELAPYIATHGRGYSRFEHTAHGIASELTQFVPIEGAVKISRLRMRNVSGRVRHLSVTAYVEWVLGTSRSATVPFVATEIDAETGAMFARNPWNASFGLRVAFLDMRGRQTDWTGDRREFIGRNGTLSGPAALAGSRRLSGAVGAGLDPCGALRTTVDLPLNGTVEIVVLLGQSDDVEGARALVKDYRTADLDGVSAEVSRYWDDVLGAIQVKTPDRSMDLMLNGWLLYQTLACRIWARSAFYQASGAYGFRDQLQDGMALVATRPQLTREHLLRAAGRQFEQGDVQHWWLPHSGQGIRTRISDDRAWLAYAVAQYVEASGDLAVLDEPVPFLEGQMLAAGEHDNFFLPTASDRTATLFEHCALALDASLALGGHGLPLMGTGDWNDGMNRVGERGEGESVWLGWFLSAALGALIPLARARAEAGRVATWEAHAKSLRASLEREAWDGEWYRRGFFDDGTALGSVASEECKIDSIAQSWAVLSGAGEPVRADRAMMAVERELVLPFDKLALLFAPPFDKTSLDPGYIKGYPPGVRENGGQYTHGALWSVMALAEQGEGGRAAALFSLLNPVNHARTLADVHRYKVEPYVVAADIYARPPHVGRGGWTWYTGSAGWMQRAGIESILGVSLHGDMLLLNPCIPKTWAGFEITLRHGNSRYEIKVDNSAGTGHGVVEAALDDAPVAARPLRIRLLDDGATRHVTVRLG